MHRGWKGRVSPAGRCPLPKGGIGEVRLQSNHPVEPFPSKAPAPSIIRRDGSGGPVLLKLVAGESTGGFVDVFMQVEK